MPRRRPATGDRVDGTSIMLGAAAAPLKPIVLAPRARSALGCDGDAVCGGGVGLGLGVGGGGGMPVVEAKRGGGRVGGMATGRQLSGLSMSAMMRELGDKVVALERDKKALEERLLESEKVVVERVPMVRELGRVREVAAGLERELAEARAEIGELKREIDEKARAAARWRPSRVGTPATVGTPAFSGVAVSGKGSIGGVSLAGSGSSGSSGSGRGERGSFERANPLCVDDLDKELRAALEASIPEAHRGGDDEEMGGSDSEDYDVDVDIDDRVRIGCTGRDRGGCGGVESDVRVAALMRMLDDRNAAEAERAAAAARAREAVEAKLAAAERDAAAERAGRVAAEREAAAVISRLRGGVRSGGACGATSPAPMLGVTAPAGSGGRGRRRVERFFTWATDGGRDQEERNGFGDGNSPPRL